MVDESKAALRKPRADAERNRQHLLQTAKALFEMKGSEATLEEIARDAGVGIGTLYRHFPTRDELVEAVYRNETEELAAAARRFSERLAPVEALRAWMRLFVDHLATKHNMSEALNSLVGGTSALYAASTDLIMGSMTLLIDRAAASGEIRLEMNPLDLLRALAGVMTVGSGPDAKANARQLVDVLIAGIRVQEGGAARRSRDRGALPSPARDAGTNRPKNRPARGSRGSQK
jgi:AcrR family transcriptional regulator